MAGKKPLSEIVQNASGTGTPTMAAEQRKLDVVEREQASSDTCGGSTVSAVPPCANCTSS